MIVSARNARHAQAIAMEVDAATRQQGRVRSHAAGLGGESRWVLLDFDDVVLHVFLDDARSFYALEDLWADVPRVQPLPSGASPQEVGHRASGGAFPG